MNIHCGFASSFMMSESCFACRVCGCAAQNARCQHLHLDLENINIIDDLGNQATHIAARLNHVDCLKILIKHDAPMRRKNFAGESFTGIDGLFYN